MKNKKNKQDTISLQIFGNIIVFSKNMIIKSILIIIICLIGIGLFVYKNSQTNKDIQMAQALQIFLKIDDIAHEGIVDGRKRWENYESGYELFYEIDTKFHAAKTIKEKIRYAKEIDELMEKMDKFMDNSGLLDDKQSQKRDKKYDDINLLFDTIIK
ncbi:MAG: hypothetical protein WC010_03405 [Candidatus Absconditabacterales bacterium]